MVKIARISWEELFTRNDIVGGELEIHRDKKIKGAIKKLSIFNGYLVCFELEHALRAVGGGGFELEWEKCDESLFFVDLDSILIEEPDGSVKIVYPCFGYCFVYPVLEAGWSESFGFGNVMMPEAVTAC